VHCSVYGELVGGEGLCARVVCVWCEIAVRVGLCVCGARLLCAWGCVWSVASGLCGVVWCGVVWVWMVEGGGVVLEDDLKRLRPCPAGSFGWTPAYI
jgi:hypothetical protein